MISIHPTAIVDPQAIIAEGCTIGPYAIIGPEVVMGEDCEVHSHAVITGKTTLGKKNRIFYHACVGGIPQDKKYHGETAELVIGDNNLIREYCTINTGSAKDEGGITRVGNDNWIMAYVHIAHNCNIGNGTVLVNSVQLAGHVEVGDYAVIGGNSVVHQFSKIGPHVMVATHSQVLRDIPPFVTAGGHPAVAITINITGLTRRGFNATQIANIREAFRILYRRGLANSEILQQLATIHDEDTKTIYRYLSRTIRGVIKLKKHDSNEESQTLD